MKAQLKNGTIIECTVEEYKELVSVGLVGGVSEKKTTITRPVKKEEPLLKESLKKNKYIGSSDVDVFFENKRKWTDAQLSFIKNNRDQNMFSLSKHFRNRTPQAIYMQLRFMGKKEGFPMSSINTSGLFTSKSRGHEKSSGTKWSDEEVAVLKAGIKNNDSFKDIASRLPLRNAKAVQERARKLGLLKEYVPKKNDSKKKTRVINFDDKHRDYLSKRLKFINNRGKSLSNEMGWSFEKARSQASLEWDEAQKRHKKNDDFEKFDDFKKKDSKKEVHVVEKTKFPRFSVIADFSQHLLVDLVKNMMMNEGTIAFEDMFFITNSTGSTRWTTALWEDFISEFMTNSEKIANYFCVKNKFSIRKKGPFNIIKYGG